MRLIMEYLPGEILLALVLAVVVTVAFRIARKPPTKKLIVFFGATFLASAYIFVACRVLFNVMKFGIYGDTSPYYGNYVAFKTIMEYVSRGHFGIFFAQVAGNILVTLPLPLALVLFAQEKNEASVLSFTDSNGDNRASATTDKRASWRPL